MTLTVNVFHQFSVILCLNLMPDIFTQNEEKIKDILRQASVFIINRNLLRLFFFAIIALF